jgi:hypothetical protein
MEACTRAISQSPVSGYWIQEHNCLVPRSSCPRVRIPLPFLFRMLIARTEPCTNTALA